MAGELIHIVSSALPADTHVVSMQGREAISQVYHLQIGLLSADPSFDPDAAVLARATVEMDLGPTKPKQIFHGVLAAVELLHEFGGKTLYRALLVPELWKQRLTRHSRVFVNQTVPEILEEVLQTAGVSSDSYQLKLMGSYQPLEFVAQYKESNFDFLSRWMEREGMYYFFEQGTDREKLIIGDSLGVHEGSRTEAVRYVPLSQNNQIASEAFDSFVAKSQAVPAAVQLWDYDYQNPALEVKGDAAVYNQGFGEVASWAENFLSVSDGNRLATIRAQEFRAQQKVFRGQGRAFLLRAGYTFTLDEHPRDAFNVDYLVTELVHVANQSANDPKMKELLGIESDDEYSCKAEAIPAAVQYRAPLGHLWPRVDGFESAVVCGPANSEYAQIDEHGRYLLRVHFDESDLGDGKASTWVRMLQPHAGGTEGFHFPLRKNTEVMLVFLGGDPDRPVIAGAIPNATTPSPVVQDNHTQNVIVTGGDNKIVLEDNSGQQFIFISTPTLNTHLHMGDIHAGFNVVFNSEGHAHFHWGGKQVIDVDLTLIETVKLDVTFNYEQSWLVNVTVDNNVEVKGDMSVHVVGDVSYKFDSDWNVKVAGDHNVKIGGDQNIKIGADQNIKIGVDQNTKIGGDQNTKIGGDQNILIGGYQNVTVGGTYTQTDEGDSSWFKRGNEFKVTMGASSTTFIGLKNSNFIGGKFDFTAAVGMGITLGYFGSLKLANELSYTGGTRIALKSGTDIGLTAGTSISAFLGAKLSLEASVAISLTTGVKIELIGAPKIKAYTLNLKTGALELVT